MKLFLRLRGAGLYYAGPRNWVRDRERALHLETIKRATEVAQDEDLDSVVMVVSSGEPGSDWFMPLRRRQAVLSQAAPANVQPSLAKAAQAQAIWASIADPKGGEGAHLGGGQRHRHSKERQQQIFDMLKRLHHDDKHPGTGMGLAMVRTAMQRMGGAVCLDSEPGQGSRFCVELPAATQP